MGFYFPERQTGSRDANIAIAAVALKAVQKAMGTLLSKNVDNFYNMSKVTRLLPDISAYKPVLQYC